MIPPRSLQGRLLVEVWDDTDDRSISVRCRRQMAARLGDQLRRNISHGNPLDRLRCMFAWIRRGYRCFNFDSGDHTPEG